MDDNITELPTGTYNAVRTLRHALQKAERGEIVNVIIIAYESDKDDDDDDAMTLSSFWSEMSRMDVLWATRWFNSWLNHRYFGQWHTGDD